MRSDVLNQNSNKYGVVPNAYKVSAKTADFTAASGYAYVITKLDVCDVTLPAPNIGDKMILYSSSSGEETSLTDDKNQHGLFTYHFLKILI